MKQRQENGEHNDFQGEWTQRLVADWFEELMGLPTVIKDTRGIDIYCGDMKVEVKSIRSIVRTVKKTAKYPERSRMNGFKIDIEGIKPETTHYAFVTEDERVLAYPNIYVVEAKYVWEFINPEKKGSWGSVPLWWVLNNFNRHLSTWGNRQIRRMLKSGSVDEE